MTCDIAFVIRCDAQLQALGFRRVAVRTSRGLHDRIYVADVDGVRVAVIYGRHEEQRVPSHFIDFAKTQEAINRLGVKVVVGTFITGSIPRDAHRGTLWVPHDVVAVGGGYPFSMYATGGFRNVDPLQVFCPRLRACLVESAGETGVAVRDRGVYACFHGFPRFETAAELAVYERLGYDIVGQTIDPEATLARESTCCYAGICVTIDDFDIRARKAVGDSAFCDREIGRCITEGRTAMAAILFAALPRIRKAILDAPLPCPCRTEFHHAGPDPYMRSRPEFEVPFLGEV
jgi:purine nucleoside phosphorylase